MSPEFILGIIKERIQFHTNEIILWTQVANDNSDVQEVFNRVVSDHKTRKDELETLLHYLERQF